MTFARETIDDPNCYSTRGILSNVDAPEVIVAKNQTIRKEMGFGVYPAGIAARINPKFSTR
jgi:hypothetical protein